MYIHMDRCLENLTATVKGVRAQDRESTATEFVARADRVAGVVSRRTNGEGRLRREREVRELIVFA